jgi:Zn-dependent protease
MGQGLPDIVIRFFALLPALVGHEFAHAYSAWKFGDPTPRLDGRVTLNPLAHLDPIGTLMILFGPIGWAKPVRVNPYNMRQPARHLMLSTAFGPLSNVVQGCAWGLVLRLVYTTRAGGLHFASAAAQFLVMVTLINFALACFNLVPLGPLDGHEILTYFLPYPQKVAYHRFNSRYGMAVLIGLIMFSYVTGVNALGIVLWPAAKLFGLVTGLPIRL